jgi:hypothetical protein
VLLVVAAAGPSGVRTTPASPDRPQFPAATFSRGSALLVLGVRSFLAATAGGILLGRALSFSTGSAGRRAADDDVFAAAGRALDLHRFSRGAADDLDALGGLEFSATHDHVDLGRPFLVRHDGTSFSLNP